MEVFQILGWGRGDRNNAFGDRDFSTINKISRNLSTDCESRAKSSISIVSIDLKVFNKMTNILSSRVNSTYVSRRQEMAHSHWPVVNRGESGSGHDSSMEIESVTMDTQVLQRHYGTEGHLFEAK